MAGTNPTTYASHKSTLWQHFIQEKIENVSHSRLISVYSCACVCVCVTLQAWCWYLWLPRLSSDTQMTHKHNVQRSPGSEADINKLSLVWSITWSELGTCCAASWMSYLCFIILKFHILSYCCNGYSVWWLTFWNKTKMLTELHKIR